MFENYETLKTFNNKNMKTNSVVTMHKMFSNCNSLASLDTRLVTDFSNMLPGCEKISKLELNNFKTNKDGDLSSMFLNCKYLKT